MADPKLDPTFRNARREALVILVIYTVSLLYTILFCHFFAYNREPETIRLYLGIPDWVVWGVMLPWAVNVGVTFWFCFIYMADDNLDIPPDEPEIESELRGEGTGES
ncbi:MAG: DUF997 family protein [Candidatus Omnitrophica bacterium]|nr:DUF997 family protein [Candidatus Omnitrophota bacterium]